jgi:SAM-dependent methyltransferase
LHAIEHFGLGRYGDPVDYFGYLKAIENISRILRDNGTFYFSVPIGPQRVEFNAHRVFSIAYLKEILERDFRISKFAYVDDRGDFHRDVELSKSAVESNLECHFGCGIFSLIKKSKSNA